ncbi:acetate--CoA ligase family protein [Kineosporia sp. A_224]|uniref:acetate--CoA ligase family protein n=1 Tax=Kineosporia sp. A_224 TaxID=1962180 RepID=UPI00130470EC|nr:acetate--CoA ligase family protein [Kineosporia sp. A_224]
MISGAALGRLLAPASVAVVGATDRAGAYGRHALENLLRAGFAGRVVAVNPGRRDVLGVPCVPSLADAGAVDAVVVATPAATVPDVLATAAGLRCGGAVVLAAGFAETGDAGAQDRLLAAAGAMPVVGPNSNGVVAVTARAPMWGDAVTLPDPAAATTALVTQSGNLGVLALAHRAGLGLHTVVSLGNAASVDAAAALGHLAAAPGVRVVAAYLEADGDGARTAAALARCAERDVRVVVLKAGRSAEGRTVGGAHTASLSGDHAAFAALAREAGAVLVTSPHDLFETARALAAGRRDPRGCAVVTCSGGDAAVAADLAADTGVALTRWSPATLAALTAALPATATPTNPLDHTNLVWDDPAALHRIGAAVTADPDVGHALYVQDEPAGLSPSDAGEWRRTRDGALAGLAAGGAVPMLVATTPGQEPAGAVGGLRPALLAEHEVLPLLVAAGVAVPAHGVAATAAQAGAVAARLGVPVAVKLSAPGLLHASEAGGVVLGIDGAAAVEAVAARLLATPGLPTGARVLVAAMAAPGTEVLVSARADGVVPTLVVGLGGIWSEALADVVTLPLPVTGQAVRAGLLRLRGSALLTGGRGRPAVDLDALVALAARVGDLLLGCPDLASVELNPVLVNGSGAVAVDALALWTGRAAPA